MTIPQTRHPQSTLIAERRASSGTGLFGLIGLLGLAGLFGLKRRDDHDRHDRNDARVDARS